MIEYNGALILHQQRCESAAEEKPTINNPASAFSEKKKKTICWDGASAQATQSSETCYRYTAEDNNTQIHNRNQVQLHPIYFSWLEETFQITTPKFLHSNGV